MSRHRSPKQEQHPVLPGGQQRRRRVLPAHPHRVLRPPEAHHGAEGCGGTAGHRQPGPHAAGMAGVAGTGDGMQGPQRVPVRAGNAACVCTCMKGGECSGWGAWSPVQRLPEDAAVIFVCGDVAPHWS